MNLLARIGNDNMVEEFEAAYDSYVEAKNIVTDIYSDLTGRYSRDKIAGFKWCNLSRTDFFDGLKKATREELLKQGLII